MADSVSKYNTSRYRLLFKDLNNVNNTLIKTTFVIVTVVVMASVVTVERACFSAMTFVLLAELYVLR